MKDVELEKAYDPASFEDKIYAMWEERGRFSPEASADGASDAPPFVVVIPPPNVTGILHMGHALNISLQDIVIRYRRMKGEPTLWVPGTDHAGIATQNVVERRLKAEGKTRRDLGREKFIERAWEVKNEHHAVITRQLKKIGASVDWSRERFTLDDGLSAAVREAFVSLYERGLVYRGNYLVNWCSSCGTALADDEVEHEDTPGAMYHIYYEIAGGESIPAVTLDDGSVYPGGARIEIATTRPETLLGDTAVAVHPDDPRYAALIGKRLKLPLTDRTIPVVADSYVDRAFGTGAVKITPAHDPNDWEMAKRHNLEIINILNPDGTLNDACPERFRGTTIAAARKAVVEELTRAGLFKEEEKIAHSVGHCYRCHTIVEPYLSEQWFVKMKPLADKALAAWKKGEIKFFPRKWENTYARWLENIRDWCISRQLWWGHRLPVWYCGECGETIVARAAPESCPKCSSRALRQDPDVLDTWFSSWLWPFSTLGWPQKTSDLAKYYPTTALITAYDIIFFWVSRMIMAGLEFTGKAPFRDIYIHGLVRDKRGRKMSKSLGNGIDPLTIVEKYGADALKFTLSFLCAQGQDVLIDEESFKLGSKFANKIWNASRYILGNLEDRELIELGRGDYREIDLWIYHRLNQTARSCSDALEHYRYNDAAQTLYEFFWNDFCDWYVEISKLSFRGGDAREKNRALTLLLDVLEKSLRLLHPYLPFVTEEIYQKLPNAAGDLIAAEYPRYDPRLDSPRVADDIGVLQEIIRIIRLLRAECGVPAETKLRAVVLARAGGAAYSAAQKACREYGAALALLAGAEQTAFISDAKEKPKDCIGHVGAGFEVFILISGNADKTALLTRFRKEIEKEERFAAKTEARLANENFTANAPAEVVAQDRKKLDAARVRLDTLRSYIRDLER